MKSPIYYNGQTVFTLTNKQPVAASAYLDPVRIDLQQVPWKDEVALIFTAKTTNDGQTAGIGIIINYAFSIEELTPSAAMDQLSTRMSTFTVPLPSPVASEVLVREFVTGRVAVQGRYLYIGWVADNPADGIFDLEVHAIPVA